MVSEVEVELWDKTRTQRVWAGDPTLLTATPRHNQQPTGSLTLPADHDRAAFARQKGARVVVRYRGEHLLSGPIRSCRASGRVRAQRQLTFEIADDWRLLSRLLAWQVPGAAITAQSSAEYHVLTGPAETVAKTLLGAAITRTGAPITVAPDLGRGATITVRARMSLPSDLLPALLDQAGIGLTVRQLGSTLVLDAYEPQPWPGRLSEAAGTLASVEWSEAAPGATRVVLGADGDGTARVYRRLVDATLETQYGDVVEVFVDARDLKSTDPGFEATATARMQEALAQGRPLVGLQIALAEAGRFRYGGASGVHVGDVLTVEIDPGVPVTDVLRAATLTWDRTGARVTPVVGERTGDVVDQLGRAIGATRKSIRQIQTRR